MSRAKSKFKKIIENSYHLFSPGINRMRLCDINRSYSTIEICIKEGSDSANILKKVNPYTHDATYQCERCDNGGIVFQDLICLAENKGGQINNELYRCNKCSNYWNIDVQLLLSPTNPTQSL